MRLTSVVGLVMSAQTQRIAWSKLAKAWARDFPVEESPSSARQVAAALTRTIPLLEDPTAVPFVCRYRADVIAPLSTKLVHQLSEYLQKHRKLEGLRQRILDKLPEESDAELRLRVETTISQSELEDIYAPFKPPSKGSLEDRIKKEHPGLPDAVDNFWSEGGDVAQLTPRPSAVTLLANRIASHPPTMDVCQELTKQTCGVKVAKAKKDETNTDDYKYKIYFDFQAGLSRLRDHQVLAIRRGVDKKVLKMTFDIDGERAEGRIRDSLRDCPSFSGHVLWKEAVHDAWSRLLRKRCTTRAWKAKCNAADERAMDVFCDNLRKALLEPPAMPARSALALDPGHRAGIKIAILDANGQLVPNEKALTTVHFTESGEKARLELEELLKVTQEQQASDAGRVAVALGNGHGTQEARKLVLAASESSGIPIDVHLVNEAGASVWSVTEAASREFPNESPASIAAISIGRRYQNPLPELVKIPPRSLGLGMYQHDFPVKVLEEKLHVTSVDAVAEVGVDANACSVELLYKVPGITKVLADRIIKARPLRSRDDLRAVSGLGPKTFECCAGFIRVEGDEDLDRTLCHPESYELARFLLDKLSWNLNDASSVGSLPPNERRAEEWKDLIRAATTRFDVSEERVISVIEHLHVSITNPDPRLRNENVDHELTSDAAGNKAECSPLPPTLTAIEELRKACPVRKIRAHVRNVVDFGAFVDFGGENVALIHRTKLGTVSLNSLLVGQEIAIDILGVSEDKRRITASLSGLGLPAESSDSQTNKRGGSSQSHATSMKRQRIGASSNETGGSQKRNYSRSWK